MNNKNILVIDNNPKFKHEDIKDYERLKKAYFKNSDVDRFLINIRGETYELLANLEDCFNNALKTLLRVNYYGQTYEIKHRAILIKQNLTKFYLADIKRIESFSNLGSPTLITIKDY